MVESVILVVEQWICIINAKMKRRLNISKMNYL